MKEKQGEMKMLRNAIFLISFAINTTNVVTKPSPWQDSILS